MERHLVETLSAAGFLEDERFARDARPAPPRVRGAAGARPPPTPARRTRTIRKPCARPWRSISPARLRPAKRTAPVAIAAPHVSPEGGWQSYRDAYSMLRPEHRDRTFVILATSHYGEPEKFGLTRKNFATPLGEAVTDQRLVDWLAERGGGAVQMEDYCLSFEHTVEFQVIFLQHVLGPDVRILPMLCGPFAQQPVPGRRSGRRRWREALPRRARRIERPRRRPPVLGARRRHGAHGRPLRRPLPGRGAPGRDERRGVPRRAAHRAHQPGRCRGLLGPGAGKPRRSEVVRIRRRSTRS